MKEAFERIQKRLEKLLGDTNFEKATREVNESYYEGLAYAYGEALSIVSEVEAEYGNGWIPCEREMPPQPEENPEFDGKPVELYLVSLKGTKYPWRAFWNGKNFTDGWSIVHPEAWMPLPEEYKPEKGGK